MNTQQKRYTQRKKVFLAALFFAGSTTLLATVTATKGAMNTASLIAQEESGAVSETATTDPVSSEERTQRFEDIISRTRDQYTALKQMVAADIERDLTASLHAGAPEEDKAEVLRHERWDREGSFWMYGIEEVARWFGLQW